MRRILIAEGHPVARAGFRSLLAREFRPVEFGQAATRDELLDLLAESQWHIVLLDLALSEPSGIELVREVCTRHPDTPVLVVSGFPEDVYASEALRAGAAGYLSKASPAAVLLHAVWHVLSGRRYVSPEFAERMVNALNDAPGALHERLSPREIEVFRSLAKGVSITVMAQTMGLSVKTVSTYRTRILEKMGFRANADIVAYYMRLNLDAADSGDNDG